MLRNLASVSSQLTSKLNNWQISFENLWNGYKKFFALEQAGKSWILPRNFFGNQYLNRNDFGDVFSHF